MKQLLLCKTAVLLLLLLTITAHAKVWRVNNRSDFNGTTLWGAAFGGTNLYPVFKQINQAVAWTNILDGDTLHIEGSPFEYNRAEINKRLVLLGPGYFLNENPNSGVDLINATVNGIIFQNNSQGSICAGLKLITPNVNDINVSNITIMRCLITNNTTISLGLTGIFFIQNFFSKEFNATLSIISTSGSGSSEITFNNNIFQRPLIWSNRTIFQCKNNIFDGPPNTLNIDFNCTDFRNNILKATGATASLNGGNLTGVTHNTGSLISQFGNLNNNLVIADINTLFVDPASNSTDGDYQLKSGSANGNDGTERGAFGGASVTRRYTLSGLSPIPVIYDISTSGVAGPGGLQVTIKAKVVQ